MKNAIDVRFTCEQCDSSIEIEEIRIDLVHCEYRVYGNCIRCGNPALLILALEDFIDLDRLDNLSRNQKPTTN